MIASMPSRLLSAVGPVTQAVKSSTKSIAPPWLSVRHSINAPKPLKSSSWLRSADLDSFHLIFRFLILNLDIGSQKEGGQKASAC
jgi:hypothetical protein